MLKLISTLLAINCALLTFGQMTEHDKMMQLARVYKDNMFIGKTPKAELSKINKEVPTSLKTTTEFIAQTITTKNKLITPKYLARPNDEVLKQIFIIRALELNMRDGKQFDNPKIMDSLSKADIPMSHLLDNYYGMLFASDGNKNKPFNFSKVDFKLDDYNLKNDTEKGVFFLKCMDYCGKMIWGYMNIVNPPNTAKALKFIVLYPKFNGRPYYDYADFYFADFDVVVERGKEAQSFKSYYLNQYYEVLLSHLLCLIKEEPSNKNKDDLLVRSILKDEKLYQFTEYKETLESLFQKRN